MSKRVAVHGIDHVSVPVRDLDAATSFYGRLFATDFYPFDDPTLGAWGGGRGALCTEGIHLIEATGGELAAFVDRCGEAGFAMALRVPELDTAARCLEEHGLRTIGDGSGTGWRGALFHPADTHGVALKLVEYHPHYRVADLEVVTAWRTSKDMDPVPAPAEGPAIRSRGIDHVICFVRDLPSARSRFGSLLQTTFGEPHGSGVQVSIDGLGIELLSSEEARDPYGVHAFFERRRSDEAMEEGIGAVSFVVDGFAEALHAMQQLGHQPLGTRDLPTRKVALFTGMEHPGIGIELIEYRHLAHPLVCLGMTAELVSARS